MRTVMWDDEKKALKMIDQRLLPVEFKIAEYLTYQDVARAISDMVVRELPPLEERLVMAWR